MLGVSRLLLGEWFLVFFVFFDVNIPDNADGVAQLRNDTIAPASASSLCNQAPTPFSSVVDV